MTEICPPTPYETDALAQEELRTADANQCNPAARALASYLRDVSAQTTGKGDDRTNVIDQGTRTTYSLDPASVSGLFAHLDAARRAGLVAHFSERQGTPAVPMTGLMLDYDMRVASVDARLLDRHVHRIACRVVRAMRRDLVFPAAAGRGTKEVKLHVFTIVKEAPVPDKGGFKYGFHLLIPGARMTRGYKKLLMRELREDSTIKATLADLGGVGDQAGFLDMNSASVPVLFLGSCKRGGVPYVAGPAFEITFEAAFEGATQLDGDFYPMVQAVNLADAERKGYNLVAEMALGFEAAYPPGAPVAAPLVPAWDCACRPEIESAADDIATRTQGGVIPDGELLLAEHALSTLAIHDAEARYLHQVLDLLDPSYYTERGKWRDVIFALANTSNTYKPLAEWFSQKCPAKWMDGGRDSLDTIWADAVGKRGLAAPLTKRSLFRWAQECNPERFRQISDKNHFTMLAKFAYEYEGVLEHYMVAKVLYSMLSTKFVVDVADGHRGSATYCWYEFVVPGQPAAPGEVWKWRKEVEPDELHNYISEHLVKVFDQIAQHLEEKRSSAEDEGRAKFYQRVRSSFMISRRKIFNDTFKNGIVKQANYLFRRRNFARSLDSDPLVFGTGNGLLRLGPTCVFVNHFHEHLISKFTPVAYRPFDASSPWTRLLLNAFADIIPEEDVRNWILMYAASSLAGGVKEGILLLWYGGGANAKTFVMRILAKTFGPEYAKKLNIAVLTSDRESADRPNSAVMQLKGCNFGYVEETQKAEPLNTQRLKEVVNAGEISCRELKTKQETFEVTANLMVGQNYNFVINTTDHGTWRRLRHYCSKVKFCADPDPANPFEKKEDQRFIREYVNDPACQEAMLSILVHYYQRLHREYKGLVKNVPCPTLDHETQAFRNSQDTINRFITEMVVHSPASGLTYQLADVVTMYIEWYNQCISRQRHAPSEIAQDFENSAIQKFLRRAPNKTMNLCECRILTPENRALNAGESYLGANSVAQPTRAQAGAAQPPRDYPWWDGCRQEVPADPREDMVGFDDSALLPARAPDSAGCDQLLEELLACGDAEEEPVERVCPQKFDAADVYGDWPC